jgi:hypothetical protein
MKVNLTNIDTVVKAAEVPYGECCYFQNRVLMHVKSIQEIVTVELNTALGKSMTRMLNMATGNFQLVPPYTEVIAVHAELTVTR